MANNIIPFKKYKFSSNKTYFFDNNVWISLFAPLINVNEEQQKNASSFLMDITSCNSQVILNSLVLSEFTNRFLRFDFDRWKSETQNPTANYKRDYKQSQRFKDILVETKSIIRKIVNIGFVEKYPDNFNSINIENIINNFDIDFNDAYFLELCSKNNWILVTSDNDFDNIDKGITIIKI
jgi:hypothetical protein